MAKPPWGLSAAPALVGREVELELLKEAHGSARSGGPEAKHVVLVTGGAGVGKTALLQEFARFLRARHERVLEGRCYAGLGQAYQPFAEIVAQALGSLETLGAGQALLGRYVSRLEPLLPSRRASTPAGSKWQVYEALLDFVLEIGQIVPHTIFVHDLHFADPASLDLLRFLSDNLASPQALELATEPGRGGFLVVSSREGAATSGAVLQELRRLPWSTEIRLSGLGKADVAKLLQSSPVVEHLYERSGGNPHHIEELLLSLPAEVEDLFLQRIRRMPAEAQACLGALAVLGRPADLSLVAAVAGLAESTAEASLEALVEARVVTRILGRAGVAFAFAKEIQQERFYATLEARERLDLHRRAGEALLSRGAEAELLAFHFLRAGDAARGPRFAREAASGLARAHAYGEAAFLLEQATAALEGAALVQTLSDLADLYRKLGDHGRALHALGRWLRQVPEERRVEPLRRAGQVLTLRGSYGAARRLLSWALRLTEKNPGEERASVAAALAELCYLSGNPAEAEALCRQELEAGLDYPAPVQVALTNVAGKVHLQRERFEEALNAFTANLERCRRAGLRAEEAAAHNNLGIVHLRRGDYERAEEACREALAIFESMHDPAGRAFCHQNLGVLAHERADYTRALEAYHRALAGFRRVGNKTQLTNTAVNLGNLYLALGDLNRAERLISFALDAAGELSTPLLLAYGHNLLGETLCAQERWDAARVYLDRAQALFQQVGSHRLVAEVRLNLARLWIATGKLKKADQALRKVEAFVFTERIPKVAGLACLLRADLCSATGDLEAATGFYEWSLDLCDADGDEEGIWRAHHGLGRLALKLGQTLEAENHYLKARTTIEALASRVPADLRETYLAEKRRRAVLQELREIGRNVVRPAQGARHPPPAVRLAEPLFRAAARDLSQVHSEFAGRHPGGIYEGIIGQSSRLLSVLRLVDRVAPSLSTVLLRGESGTGKELVAKAIHRASPRRDKPFVKVNCASFVETLLLSELFGHEKGAFTGAVARKRGRFELADGGTLFLDEIGDISAKTQVALLRVLQEREFERVGGVQPLRVDVRILCATHRDLEAMVRAGEFREDLYYRLKGIEIVLPSLRERREDIPLLASHFLEATCRADGRPPMRFDDEAMEMLLAYPWPGNVRELENLVRSAVLLCEGDVISKKDLCSLREFQGGPVVPPATEPGVAPVEEAVVERVLREEIGLAEMKKRIELACIRRALQRTGGNITQAARLLQMKRPRLSQIVKEYGDLLKVEEG
jgi:DNA-binding NtrC family response regulator/tetratricopeptide (TPR) repeat protein